MREDNRYNAMRHRFDPVDFLLDVVSHKGTLYPGMFVNWAVKNGPNGYPDTSLAYDNMPQAPVLRTETAGGTPIRRQDASGRWYFMPVWVRSSLGELEFPCAVISVTGKKRIVETPLTGRRGSVNELVSVDSYEINVTAALVGADGNYPDSEVKQMRDLYELNEAVELISALTDLVFEKDDKVIFKSVDFPAVGGVENVQVVKMTARTDAAVELIIE